MNQKIIEKSVQSQDEYTGPRFLIGVRIENELKSKLYDPGKLHTRVGIQVMVETEQGIQMGVIASNKIPNIRKECGTVGRILRIANANDSQAYARKQQMESRAKELYLKSINELKLEMNLSRVIYHSSQNKTTFFFTAEGRVDFRQLIKKLVSTLKHRVEMKQVGVRDEARSIAGYGVCGESLCCASFIKEFTPVTIRMAKDQGLSLNPSKISGVCGRLMCCLQYEHQIYKELTTGMPKTGDKIQTPDGPGRVLKNDILGQTVLLRLDDESIQTYSIEELKSAHD